MVAIIQARLGSVRFPRKILADLAGRPVLQHVIDRATQIQGVDTVVVGCPAGEYAELASAVSGAAVEGAADSRADSDVLGRFADLADLMCADVIVRLTGDCPLIDPAVAAFVLQRFFALQADYATNDVNLSGYPDGEDVEVFTCALLDRAHAEAVTPQDREHVTPIMRRLLGVKVAVVMKPGATSPSLDKWSIDTPEDLARVAAHLRADSSTGERGASRDAGSTPAPSTTPRR